LNVSHTALVLMDIQTPETDDLEPAKVIRQHWHGEESPYFIAVTAHALDGDRLRCLDAGMDDYISKHIHENSKPMKIEELVGALCKYSSIRNKNISSLGSCSPP